MSTPTPDEFRECVTCGTPVVAVSRIGTSYVHTLAATGETVFDHPAQPKLAHPMDNDPFAGLDSEDI